MATHEFPKRVGRRTDGASPPASLASAVDGTQAFIWCHPWLGAVPGLVGSAPPPGSMTTSDERPPYVRERTQPGDCADVDRGYA
jgi:hypothetical protein